MENKTCFLCQVPCDQICPFCNAVKFCSEEHFRLHRVKYDADFQVSGKENLVNLTIGSIFLTDLLPFYIRMRMTVMATAFPMKPAIKKASAESWLPPGTSNLWRLSWLIQALVQDPIIQPNRSVWSVLD